jgi:hypothetical protein
VSETSIEPVLGWRLWHVRLHNDEHRLESFTMHHVSWPAGRCAVHGESAPAHEHECGIYAFKMRVHAEELLRRYTGVRHRYGREYRELPPVRQGRPIALGSVSLWGRILARERGYRAQYAYPYELFVIGGDERIARELRDRYAVDVSLL